MPDKLNSQDNEKTIQATVHKINYHVVNNMGVGLLSAL